MVDWQSRNTVGKQTAARQEPKDEGRRTKVARKKWDNSARRLQCHFSISISSSKEQVAKVSGDQRLPVKSRTRRHLDTTEVPSATGGAATRRVNWVVAWVVRKWQGE